MAKEEIKMKDVGMPKFVNTKWAYLKPKGGWGLKPGAPKDIQKSYDDFVKVTKNNNGVASL